MLTLERRATVELVEEVEEDLEEDALSRWLGTGLDREEEGELSVGLERRLVEAELAVHERADASMHAPFISCFEWAPASILSLTRSLLGVGLKKLSSGSASLERFNGGGDASQRGSSTL